MDECLFYSLFKKIHTARSPGSKEPSRYLILIGIFLYVEYTYFVLNEHLANSLITIEYYHTCNKQQRLKLSPPNLVRQE